MATKQMQTGDDMVPLVVLRSKTRNSSQWCRHCGKPAAYEAVCGSAHIAYCGKNETCKKYAIGEAIGIARINARQKQSKVKPFFPVPWLLLWSSCYHFLRKR